MAEIKITDLPLMTEEEFTANDRFLMIDDGDARAMTKVVFESWVRNNVRGERGEEGLAGRDGAAGKDGKDGLNGKDGLSAYQVALAAGFVGTQSQWLASLKGNTGANGANGFNGWTPAFKTATRGEEVVLQLHDWFGGTGTKPTVTGYVGESGIVTNIANAVNIKGIKGDKGDIGLTGEKGDKGVDGKAVSSINFNSDLSVTVNYTDGTTVRSGTPPIQFGWASYKDGQYKDTSPFTLGIASQSVLPNNAVEKIEHLPTGVTTFYNVQSQKYLLQDPKGLYSVRVRFKAVASNQPSFINVSMSKDTTETPFSEDRALRGDTSIQDFTFSTEIYGDAALSANGLSIRIKTYDRAISIYNIEVMIGKVI